MTRRARAVIGGNFGDEGKGLSVDYLCDTQGAGVVIRFNGGAQAGHTVVTPDGRRHVFSHVGSGAFCGVPTYLSEFFIANPLMLLKELDALNKIGVVPTVFASPKCYVTTFADMLINQRIEDARAGGRHGSVGLGIGETWERSQMKHLEITMGDIWNGNVGIERKLKEICGKYALFRTGKEIDKADEMIEAFLRACETMAKYVHPLGISECYDADPIFEGAQGLLLDQNNKDFFPHVTRSNTGLKNVVALCDQMGIKRDEIQTYFVTRTYVTRHGAGPLPSHDPGMAFQDDTNLEHPYQGTLRFAPLNPTELAYRLKKESEPVGGQYKLIATHCDQLAPPRGLAANWYAYGPTRMDVESGIK